MATKKDIGKIFKDRLNGFEEAPDPGIWTSISSELDKKGNSKIAPLWYYFGSLLVIGVIGSLWFFTEYTAQETRPVNDLQQVRVIEEEVLKNKSNSSIQATKNQKKNSTSKISAPVTILNRSQTQKNQASSNNQKKSTPTRDESKSTYLPSSKLNSNSQNTLTSAKTANDHYKAKTNTQVEDDSEVTVAIIKEMLALNRQKKNESNADALALYEAQQDAELQNALRAQREENALSIALSIVKDNMQEIDTISKDQSSIDKTEESSEEDEEERLVKSKESIKYKIALSPYTSFQSYGSLTRASSLDDRLVNNPRQAISTIGYGLRAEYTLTERTRLRLGVGFSPLRYRTDNFQVTNTNGNINIFELSALSGQALSQGSTTTEGTPEAIEFFNNNTVVSIQQNISYVEVPLDFQYMFLNKRVGLSVSPGVSLFILDDNSIIASAEDGSSVLVGSESNLSSLSLAFNLGLGAHYNFNQSWRLNMEPVFRYQLNPYNNSISNFRPYYFGAQFGLSYKF